MSSYDAPYLVNIKKNYKVKITQKSIPTLREVEDIKNKLVLDEVKSIIRNDDLDDYIRVIRKNSSSGEDCVEMAAALLKMVRQN